MKQRCRHGGGHQEAGGAVPPAAEVWKGTHLFTCSPLSLVACVTISLILPLLWSLPCTDLLSEFVFEAIHVSKHLHRSFHKVQKKNVSTPPVLSRGHLLMCRRFCVTCILLRVFTEVEAGVVRPVQRKLLLHLQAGVLRVQRWRQRREE